MPTPPLSARYPALFAAVNWGPVRAQFACYDDVPPEQIANVNVVPFVGEDCLLIQLADGSWEIPGGTLEPGESTLEAATRELREEVGARLRHFQPFGAWRCHSVAALPYRAHLPHPEFYRLVGWGVVAVEGPPQPAAGGEAVAEVVLLPVNEAAARLMTAGRPDLGQLYLLAAEVRAAEEAER